MDKFKGRRAGVLIILFTLSSILLLRLFYVQIIAKEYKEYAELNSRKRHTLIPARGLITDRNGKLLVDNEAIYDIMVVPNEILPFDTALLCEILNIDKEYIKNKKEEWKKKKIYSSETHFLRQISMGTIGRFQELQFKFRGFFTRPSMVRKYHLGVAAHVLGYLSEVDENEIVKDSFYKPGDYIGKSGLERSYEKVVRGTKGAEYVMVDKLSRILGKYADGKFDEKVIPGNSIQTTIDIDLQAYGELLLKNKIGSLVAIEPSTGEILAIVSSVGYDPNLLTGRERMTNYPLLVNDEHKPLFNRAIAAMYPPGSTYKTVMALVGLQEGVITPDSRFPCHMGYTSPGLHVGCHAHTSMLNLEQSIAQSCNAYYCNVLRNVIDQPRYKTTEIGYKKWYDYMHQFGFGQKLGIDIPNEKEGILPDVSKFDKIYGKGRWKSSYIISLAIGQAEISLTPLQMANFTACIANRGYYITPHLVKNIDGDASEELGFKKNTVSIDKVHFETVVNAMHQVFEMGTGRYCKIPSIVQCGKTGTAENPHGEDHSNFIAFAPKDNPKIAIAVVVENGGFGATWAAPIASLMIEKYLNDSISRPEMELRMIEKDFIHVVPEIVAENGAEPD